MDNDNGIPIGLVFVIIIIVFVISWIMGFNTAEQKYEPNLKKWAIEQEYIQYNPKSGKLEMINKDIKPIMNLIKDE